MPRKPRQTVRSKQAHTSRTGIPGPLAYIAEPASSKSPDLGHSHVPVALQCSWWEEVARRWTWCLPTDSTVLPGWAQATTPGRSRRTPKPTRAQPPTPDHPRLQNVVTSCILSGPPSERRGFKNQGMGSSSKVRIAACAPSDPSTAMGGGGRRRIIHWVWGVLRNIPLTRHRFGPQSSPCSWDDGKGGGVASRPPQLTDHPGLPAAPRQRPEGAGPSSARRSGPRAPEARASECPQVRCPPPKVRPQQDSRSSTSSRHSCVQPE